MNIATNENHRPFTFGDEVRRSKSRKHSRELVILSATSIASMYAVGIAIMLTW